MKKTIPSLSEPEEGCIWIVMTVVIFICVGVIIAFLLGVGL